MARALHLFNIFGARTERALLECVLGIASQGWDLTCGYEAVAPEAPPTPLRIVPLKRVEVSPAEDVAGQMNAIAEQPADLELHRLLEEHFDVVHGHFGPRILQAAAWIKRRTPVLVSLYGYDVGTLLRDPCWAERYRWAAENGVTFVVLAQFMYERMINLGIKPALLRLIRLGINLDEHAFRPLPAPAAPRFVFIGRFVEKKGTATLLRAMACLRGQGGMAATLDLIGSGPLEESLRALAGSLNLHDCVHFRGTVPFAQLFDWLAGATALVQPSMVAANGDAEGAPMVLMHAQASGTPCITTRHAGNPEVLPPEGQTFVVPENDPEALAVAMTEMEQLSAGNRRLLQAQSRDWIESRYNLDVSVSEYLQLYAEKRDR